MIGFSTRWFLINVLNICDTMVVVYVIWDCIDCCYLLVLMIGNST